MRRARAIGLALVGALLAVTALALAQGGPDEEETILLPYDAPSECPEAKVFASQLEARTARARVAADAGTTARIFDVRIVKLAAGYKGTLIIQAEGGQAVRTIAARACQDVVEALALVAAVAIDPEASTQPAAMLAARESDAGVDASEGGGADAAPASIVPAAPCPAPPSRPKVRYDVFVGAGALSGPIPDVSVVATAGAGLAFGRGVLSPRFMLGIIGSLGSNSAQVGPASTAFSLLGGRLEACPVRLGGLFSFRPCLSAMVGAVTATPAGVSDGRSQLVGWVSGGAGLRLAVTTGALAVELAGEVHLDPIAAHYYVDPATPVYRSSPVGMLVTLGASVAP